MQKVNIRISLLVFFLLIISFFLDIFTELSVYIFVLLFHELVHIIVANKLGYNINTILFMPYGTLCYGKNRYITDKNEIIIAISAPLVNLFISVVILAFWWIFPGLYGYTYLLLYSNFSLGFFNLLPIFPLDGGRILYAKLRNKYKTKSILTGYIMVTIISSILFLLLFIYSIFRTINYTFLFISFFLIISIFDYSSLKISSAVVVEKKYNEFRNLPVKEFAISFKSDLRSLLKFVKNDYFSIFIFLNEDGDVVKKLTERELIEILKKN